MATLKNGIMGGLSGRLGNVVVYEMFGKTVVRSMPSVKQKKATGKRKQYQDDFKYVMKWMQYLKPLIDICWIPEPPHKKAFKPAFSHNLKRYREMERPQNYEWLELSKGEIAGLEQIEMKWIGESIQISWSNPTTEKPMHPDDTVYIQLVNASQSSTYPDLLRIPRKSGQTELTVPGWKEEDRIVAVMVVRSREQWGLFSETLVCWLG